VRLPSGKRQPLVRCVQRPPVHQGVFAPDAERRSVRCLSPTSWLSAGKPREMTANDKSRFCRVRRIARHVQKKHLDR
jgi:hypothetical protein